MVQGPDHALTKYLGKYIRDIEDGYKQADHITTPRESLESKLGIGGTSSYPPNSVKEAEELAALEKQLFNKE